MELFTLPIEEELTLPVKYYYTQTGKNIRKMILLHFGKKFNKSIEDIENIEKIISLMHNASLVIDDIQDNSSIRRNKECAHKVYGIPLALNASYLTIFKILHNINLSDIPIDIKYKITENIYYAHIGQGMDIYYTTYKIIPSLDDFYIMMKYKTGMIFITMLDLLNTKELNYNECISKFSYFFQIRDDYINLTDIDYWKEKGFCQDIDEQKISFLITYYINNKLKDYQTLLNLLKKKSIMKIIKLFHKNELFDIIYNKLVTLKNEINKINEINEIFDKLPFDKFNFKLFQQFYKQQNVKLF